MYKNVFLSKYDSKNKLKNIFPMNSVYKQYHIDYENTSEII